MEQNSQIYSQAPTQSVLKPLPNAKLSLVLGILSLVFFVVGLLIGRFGVGIVVGLGIIGVIIANKDLAIYRNNPGMYNESSYHQVKKGRICSIIAMTISIIVLLIYVFGMIWFFAFTTQG